MTEHTSEKLLYLESIRGIAALIVALLHARFVIGSPLTENYFVLQGDLMVDLFFVLSGFVISYNYHNKIHSTTNLFVFQFRRFLRLYPLHLTTLFVFIGIELVQWKYEQQTGIIGTETAFGKNNFLALINNIFLTHSFFEKSPTFNAPSWSISTEFYTYLIFATTIIFLKKDYSRILFFSATIIASGTILHIFDASGNTTGLAILRCIYSFFIGCASWRIAKAPNLKLPWLNPTALVPVVLLSIFINSIIAAQIYPLLFGLAILSLYKSQNSSLKKALSNSKLVFFGTISYGIYMWHSAVWLFITLSLKHLFGINQIVSENSRLYLDIDVYTGSLIQLTGLSIIILISWASYKLIETPINNYRHKVPFK